MKNISFSIVLALMLPGVSLHAKDEHIVYNRQGIATFQVRFFDNGDGFFIQNDPDSPPLESTWDLNQQQKEKILYALSYWAEIISSPPEQLPAVINVGTFDDDNAAGTSDNVTNGTFSLTQLQAVLTGKKSGELAFGSHAQLVIGTIIFDTIPYIPSLIPQHSEADLVSVAIHELAHGLGIQNAVSDRLGDETATPYFDETFGTWTEHLRDDNGNPARRGQVILCTGCKNAYDPKGFDVRRDQAYFAGKNVSDVLAGALPSIPVRILDDDGLVDDDYMSHSELKNSMMSHQDYRNYTTFMEAELALLQDMGYQIDRRNFYGFSIYGSGQLRVNQHGYFQRNTNGTAYIPGEYNTASLGLGLHVYGSNNLIFQEADLLTRGAGAVGVRIDGQNNELNVEPGTRIYADGLNGRGVMFTYGKDHNFIQRGDVQALGENGIAASFDFGNNLLGNDDDYRGSYIHNVKSQVSVLLSELEGALVNNVDISGRLAGKVAAIYISSNALVKNINVLNGARIEGNIDSHYNQQDMNDQPRLTRLSFGHLADVQGRTTEQVDPNFRFRYNDNINGINNLVLNVQGGITSLNGNHHVYDVNVAANAILAGNSQYTVNPAGRFVNNGIISPGNSLGSITVTGGYQQSENGQLLLEVDGKGGHDIFTVNGNTELSGQLTFAPLRDWYATNWIMSSTELLQTGSQIGDFNTVNSQIHSPTLTLQITPQGRAVYQLAMLRDSNAYSQYGQDSNARQAGLALDRIVVNAQSDMQALYRTLDFSTADGSDIAIALNQLSPASYSAMFASSLSREQQIADIISTHNFTTIPSQLAEDEWRSFVEPFGGGFWQKRHGNNIGYNASGHGIVFGAEKQSVDSGNRILGFHSAISSQSVNVKSPENGIGKTTSFSLGMQAHYATDPLAGRYMFGNGRIGIEDGEMDRRVNMDDYTAHNHANWTGFSGSLMAGGGYRWVLNENLSAGPLAALNYTLLSRRGTTETGSEGSRLKLDSKTFNSLRSRIGANGDWERLLTSGTTIKANLQLTWDHELQNTTLVQNATFAGYSNVGFSSENQVVGRDTLNVQAGVRHLVNKDVELGARVSSDLFRSGYNDISGSLSAIWRF
ncbi:MAG: autotransporter outer membrane beta-barrel domain-containing protein [Yersinia sp. (in: enterobacteria)]